MADKAFIIREAQKYLAKGQIDKAITEWETLLASFPDANSYNTAGDLYLKKSDQRSAVERFHRAADIFRKEGFSLKALAVYKKILNVLPSDARSLFALGELSEEKNISAEAAKYYMAAAEVFLKEGRKSEAVQAFSKMTGLQPDNLALRKRLAAICSKEGFVEETSHEYVEIARLLEGQGENSEAIGYLERAIEIQPSNKAALTAAASLYEKSGDPGRAIDTLRLAISRMGKSGFFLLWLSRLCFEAGNFKEAGESAREFLQIEPENMEARRLIAAAFEKEGRMEAAWEQYGGVVEKLMEANRLQEAKEVLERFRETKPMEAGRKLASLHKLTGETGAAAREFKEIGRLFEESGDKAAARLCYEEALALAPDDDFLNEKLRQPGRQEDPAIQDAAEEGENRQGFRQDGNPGTLQEMEEAPAGTALDDKILPADGNADTQRPVQDILEQAGRFMGLGLFGEAKRLLEPLRLSEPSNMEVHLKLKSVYLGTGDNGMAVTECIILAELMRRAGREIEKEEIINEAFSIDPNDPRLMERWGQRKAQEVPGKGAQPFTETLRYEKLSEAAFYVDQGLYDEAERIYNEILARFPEDRGIRTKLAELAALKSGTDAAAGGPEGRASKDPDKFGVSDESGGELERLFEDFKRGVEKELGPGDAASHYDLGIAYKEMGLIEDAIRELRSVREDPAAGPKAASVLASCYVEKGRLQDAIETLRAAIEKTDPARQTHWGLKYDLAALYEKNSFFKEALGLYAAIHGWDPAFRDTASRMEALKKAAAPPSAADAEHGSTSAQVKKNRISYI